MTAPSERLRAALLTQDEVAEATVTAPGRLEEGIVDAFVVRRGFVSGPHLRNRMDDLAREVSLDARMRLTLVTTLPLIDGVLDLDRAYALLLDGQSTYQYLAPQTEAEETVAQLLTTLLGVEPISVTDDLLELGADSLVAVELTEHLASHHGVAIDAHVLFGAGSIRDIAKLIDDAKS